MTPIKIADTALRIIEGRSMPPKSFFSPLAPVSRARSSELIGIERRTKIAPGTRRDLLSGSRTIKQTPQGPEWLALPDHMAQRDQDALKNSGSFGLLEFFFQRCGVGAKADTPITILNECLLANFDAGPVCLIRADLSSHDRLRIFADVQAFLPAWLAERQASAGVAKH